MFVMEHGFSYSTSVNICWVNCTWVESVLLSGLCLVALLIGMLVQVSVLRLPFMDGHTEAKNAVALGAHDFNFTV